MEESVFGKLKSFEKQQNIKLEKAKAQIAGKLKRAENDLGNSIKTEHIKRLQEMEESMKNAEKDAKKDAKEIIDEYNRKKLELEEKFKKNCSKAVKAIYNELLK